MDLGAGNAQAALQARIYAAVANYTGNYTVQYSDNGSTWSNAATNFVPNQLGWNSITWPSVGIHRWWRLYLTNTPGPGAWLNELQLVGETNYVYFNGKRTARRDPSGTVHYYLSDHLGSTSIVVSAAGAVENESEYYPWGGELKFSSNDSGNHYKFTGKERDSETNLDYFGARYYGNTLGRFLTPDWAAKPVTVPYAHFGDPQSLNLYSYVRNIPTSLVDGDGHGWWGDFGSGLYESTVGPLVTAVAHPINTAVGIGKAIGHTVAHPIDTAVSVGKGTVAFGKAVIHGDGKAIGKVVGTVVSVAVTGGAVKAVSTLSKAGEVAETAATVTRYMGEGEAAVARETGFIPATDAAGNAEVIHVTTDAPVDSAAAAKSTYELPADPTHRATVPADRAELGPTPDGRATTSGGGSQAGVTKPIQVKPDEIKKLKP